MLFVYILLGVLGVIFFRFLIIYIKRLLNNNSMETKHNNYIIDLEVNIEENLKLLEKQSLDVEDFLKEVDKYEDWNL